MPVTPEQTEEALEDSIQHWDENARAEKPEDASIAADDCALCDLFWDYDCDDPCDGCPVRNVTARELCHNTPYVEAMHAFEEWRYGAGTAEEFRAAAEDFRAAAAKMRDFLISLRVKA